MLLSINLSIQEANTENIIYWDHLERTAPTGNQFQRRLIIILLSMVAISHNEIVALIVCYRLYLR